MSALIRLFRHQRSDKQRFKALLRPHIDLMYRMAWRWTGSESDAEDIVQDVLIRLADRVEQMETIDQLRPWLIKAVYNRYVDVHRSRLRDPVSNDHGADDESGDGESMLLRNHADERDEIGALQLRDSLEKALHELDEPRRSVILLHDAEGYSVQEVSEILEESPGTVKSRLHRARKQLKKFLEAGTF